MDELMIVLGADTHKSSHTVAAINTATGQLLGDTTVAVGARGFAALVIWARGLDGERMWALEDCRHVSGTLERLVIARGGGVLNLAYGALLGYAIVMTRVRGAPAAPKEARKRVTALASELHRVGGRGAAAVLPHEAT